MEKEPRRKRRGLGLDREAISSLKSASPDDLTSTTSAHAGQEAVNLLILAIMRLERALQPVHPQNVRPKDTCAIITQGVAKVKVHETAWRRPYIECSAHISVHIMLPRLPSLWIPLHRLSTQSPYVIQRKLQLLLQDVRLPSTFSPMPVDNSTPV